MIPHLEKTGGEWYSTGVMLKTKAEGKRFLLEDRIARVVGILENDHLAEALVSNIDFIHTHRNLISAR